MTQLQMLMAGSGLALLALKAALVATCLARLGRIERNTRPVR